MAENEAQAAAKGPRERIEAAGAEGDGRTGDRRQGDRRQGERRQGERRRARRPGPDRRRTDRRVTERRSAHRRAADRPRLDRGDGERPSDEELRATPMTLITPVPWRWAVWLRVVWLVTRNLIRVWPNGYPFGRLHRLSFIHFAHWSLFSRMPPNKRGAPRLRHPYLIFQSNFNRGWREYVEGFCYTVPFAMRLNWSGVPGMRAYGFPPPQPVGPFLEYVGRRFTPELHSYCAYPDASARGVTTRVEARENFNVFAGAGSRQPARFERPGRGPTPLGGPRDNTDTLSVLTPVLPGQEKDLCEILSGLPSALDKSPLARVPGTHMARWSVVAPLPFKHGKRPMSSTSYLLFTSWFDGDTKGYIAGLCSGLSRVEANGGRNLNDELWGRCARYPGTADPEQFRRYLMLHSIKPRLAFAGYPETVMEVRAGIRLDELLEPHVAAAARRSTADLERGYRKTRHRKWIFLRR